MTARKRSASSRLASLSPTSAEDTGEPDWVRVEYDPLNPPPFSDEEKADLERLRTMRDEDIDFSDIPRATESFWRNAVRGMHYRVIKQQLTIRLDADVLDWLKSGGKGWQTKLNYHLRQAMERERGIKR